MAASEKKTRSTTQKALIRSALESETRFVSAKQLHRRLEDEGASVGLATVYRQLNALGRSGDADTITIAETQLFRACALAEHHHHLVCEKCGTAIEIDPPSEDWMRTVAGANGYEITHHVFEIFGICADCRAAAAD